MYNATSTLKVALSRPKVTLLMVLCSIVGTAAAGAVSAATPEDDVPRLAVRYSSDSLATDSGARTLYHRLERAAEQVCPAWSGSRFVTSAVRACREEAIARAVHDINDSRLASVYAASTKRG